MSSLSSLWLGKEKLKQLLEAIEQKKVKGVELTISTTDEPNSYGQNVAAYVSQTKEERDADKKRFYVGNGKVFWTDGKIVAAPKVSQSSESQGSEDDSLPF